MTCTHILPLAPTVTGSCEVCRHDGTLHEHHDKHGLVEFWCATCCIEVDSCTKELQAA